MMPSALPLNADPLRGPSDPSVPSSSDSEVDAASQTAKLHLGKLFAAQRQWLNAREHHQGLSAARTVLRTFQTTTGLPVDRIRGIGGHWGRHPVLAWMEADHYPLIAAWLLEGGCLPGEWCQPARPNGPSGAPTGSPVRRSTDVVAQTLSPAGEQALQRWFVRWGQTNAKLHNSIGRAISAWARRADRPAPRSPEWAQPVEQTVARHKVDREPSPVTFYAAITVTQRGLRAVPVLRTMQQAGWDFEQAERLPSLPGRSERVTSARAWLNELGVHDQLSVPAQAAWYRWWHEQDRVALEASMVTLPSSDAIPSPTGRSRARL